MRSQSDTLRCGCGHDGLLCPEGNRLLTEVCQGALESMTRGTLARYEEAMQAFEQHVKREASHAPSA